MNKVPLVKRIWWNPARPHPVAHLRLLQTAHPMIPSEHRLIRSKLQRKSCLSASSHHSSIRWFQKGSKDWLFECFWHKTLRQASSSGVWIPDTTLPLALREPKLLPNLSWPSIWRERTSVIFLAPCQKNRSDNMENMPNTVSIIEHYEQWKSLVIQIRPQVLTSHVRLRVFITINLFWLPGPLTPRRAAGAKAPGSRLTFIDA